MPLRSSQLLEVGQRGVGVVDDLRHVVAERRDLVGDRVGEQDAEPGQRQHAARGRRCPPPRRAGSAPRRSSVTNGLSSSAISPAMMNSSSTAPGRARDRAQAEQRERQHDELDPARHHDRRDAGGRLRRRRVERHGPSAPPRASSGATSSSGASVAVSGSEARMPSVCAPGPLELSRGREPAILFVGDIVASAGPPHAQGAAARACARSSALDFVVANGENAAGGIGITPKHADELFAAGVDVITLGNHTYRHREVWPYLDEQPYILRPANFLRTQPGRGTCVFERERRHARRREPVGQPVHAGGVARRSRRSTRRCARSRAPTTCSSTCTPRRRARRSRWAGSSTAA